MITLIDLPSPFTRDNEWLAIRDELKTLDASDPDVNEAIAEVEAQLTKRGIA